MPLFLVFIDCFEIPVHKTILLSKRACSMIIIGLTGNIGAGKTTAVKLFSNLGINTIEADQIVHRLLNYGTPVWNKVLKAFGDSVVLHETNEIDKGILADLVFSDKNSMNRLLDILYPAIKEEFDRAVFSGIQNGTRALLFSGSQILEAGWDYMFDIIILIKAAFDIRIQRLIENNRFTISQIHSRAAFQWPDWIKLRYADFVIDNNRDLSYIKKQVDALYMELCSLNINEDTGKVT